MEHRRALELSEKLLEAWNTQDVELVLDCYTDDAVYLDPNTRGPVEGRDAMRRYLTQLFDRWDMHWSVREAFPLRDAEGAAVLWRATLRLKGSEGGVEVDGMDLALIEGERLSRNEVYFDRAALAALLTAQPASAAASA